MNGLKSDKVSSRLFAITASGGTVQIVASARGIVLDVQSVNTDTEGVERREHAVIRLHLDEAARVETLFRQAVDAAWDAEGPLTERTDSRQTQLWSDSTHSVPVRRAIG